MSHHPIKNIHIRNFRSLAKTAVPNCGGLNVLIGKNNAGKSSVLAVVPMVVNHLAQGRIATAWATPRPVEQFTNRESHRALQIGIEFALSESQRDDLRSSLTKAAPQLSKSIDQLKSYESVSFLLRFCHRKAVSFQYLEAVCLGSLDASQDVLQPNSEALLITPGAAAEELFAIYQKEVELDSKIELIKKMLQTEGAQFPMSYHFRDKRSYSARFVVDRYADAEPISQDVRREIAQLLEQSETEEAFRAKAEAEISEAREQKDLVSRTEISSPIRSYSGDAKIQPAYITELCRAFGAIKILTLGERKLPIGRKEASRLLQLKVRRGGPEQLRVVQQTVKSLLGVSLDAFQGDGGRESAEMDVDNFLAEANGAGIRESLRMILDLELEQSDIVILEEPEVHLHPALEFAIHAYLQEKRQTKQFFLTTHSTNFVDAMTPQHIYLITRNASGVSSCENLSAEEVPLKLPVELGIRLSTVFMFDKIVFVEGPSDEAVLRELAKTLEVNIQGAGVAFVHMGGIANFTHYAAQGTLDILTRRRVKMWFVVDKDERDESEVKRMLERLGESAELMVLERRELENFLVDEHAICCFVEAKSRNKVTHDQYVAALASCVQELKEKVTQMYLEAGILRPIYLRGSDWKGSITERLDRAKKEVDARAAALPDLSAKLEASLTANWNAEAAIRLVPGEVLLDLLCQKLGSSFTKSKGDSVKLARELSRPAIPHQVEQILNALTSAR
jgi:putative ATP-dependent endonuclease of the OLD family